MSQGRESDSPRTLADVSHLFFSGTEAARAPEGGAKAGASKTAPESPARGQSEAWPKTKLFVVTGGAGGPGKSTLALSMAHAMQLRGRAALFDADPALPNARFYAGLPSWNYLSGVTGEGEPAPTVAAGCGVLVADCSTGRARVKDLLTDGNAVCVDGPGAAREPVKYVVVDLPADRAGWIGELASRVEACIVVARAGRAGFEEAFGALAALSRRAGLDGAGLIVNMVSDPDYGPSFHAKLAEASERLLSMRLRYIGAVAFEPGLGSLQRERGSILGVGPDSAFALMLRQAVAKIA